MRAFLIIVIMLALVAALAVDGFAVYVAHRTAAEVAKGSAEQAAKTFVGTNGSESAAKEAVKRIADEAQVRLVAVRYHKTNGRRYEVTVRTEPHTHFLKHIPYLRDHLAQESTAMARF